MTFETVRENAVNHTPLLVDQGYSGGCTCRDLSAPVCNLGPGADSLTPKGKPDG
jgi:hypothetical protein